MEVTGLALAVMACCGLGILIVRRVSNVRASAVTTTLDWVLLAALAFQVVMGFIIAFFFRWGSEWYLHTAVPWLWSLATFNPQIQYVTSLPTFAKLHMLNAFFLLALFPFTRLVHVVTLPLPYLLRPYQVVIWYRNRKEAYMPAPGVPQLGPDVPYAQRGL
jgi:nitrate reductase gamma subunit